MSDANHISLDPSAAEMRHWGNSAVQTMADYLESISTRRVYPKTSAREIREQLETALPIEGTSFDRLLATFTGTIVPLSRTNAHPRMFGYVQSPGTAIAALADLLASTLNANLTSWRSAPAAVELERLTLDWIRQILGLNREAAGLFVSGGSMANLAALAAARAAKSPPRSPDKSLHIYASEETHHSITKAAALLGIGGENVRLIAVDDRCKIRIDRLVEAIEADRAAGKDPFCLVANAGTVATGSFDPLREVHEIARRFNLWMHVDASYGGFAALAPAAHPLFSGIAEADSVALDPHKWLYLPVDCGCVFYRDAEPARAAFAHTAEYTRVFELQDEEAFAFWDYGPELSRRFRALKVWMLLKGVGTRALSKAIENDLACARHLQNLVRASDDFEMLAPVELSIFCFRYCPAKYRKALAITQAHRTHDWSGEPGVAELGPPLDERQRLNIELDGINERLLIALQRDGSSYLSNAKVHGRFALRGCVMNYRTTPRDMEILLDDLRRLASAL
jgi:aromatic-L-amino-acid/L-tryptophan decarboxylase